MRKQPCVYILASNEKGTLYVGVTSDLVRRIWQHQNKVVGGFARRYEVDRLVWFELHSTMESAIKREKGINTWNRTWKKRLINNGNPNWEDLSRELF